MKESLIVLGMCVASLVFVELLDYAALRAQHPWATAADLERVTDFDSSHLGSRQVTRAVPAPACQKHRAGWSAWLNSCDTATRFETEARQQLASRFGEPVLTGSSLTGSRK